MRIGFLSTLYVCLSQSKGKVQSPAIKLKNYAYMYFEGCRYIHVCKFAVEVTMEDDAPLILEVNNPHVPGQRLRSRLARDSKSRRSTGTKRY